MKAPRHVGGIGLTRLLDSLREKVRSGEIAEGSAPACSACNDIGFVILNGAAKRCECRPASEPGEREAADEFEKFRRRNAAKE